MNFSIQNTALSYKSYLSPSPKLLAVTELDYRYTQELYVTNLFTSNTVNIINVPSTGTPQILLPPDEVLEYLFKNPTVGSVLQYVIITDNFPLQIISENSSTVLNQNTNNICLRVTSLSPFSITLEQFCSSSSSLTGATGPIGPLGPTGPTGPIGLSGFSTNTGATGPTGPQGPAMWNSYGFYDPTFIGSSSFIIQSGQIVESEWYSLVSTGLFIQVPLPLVDTGNNDYIYVGGAYYYSQLTPVNTITFYDPNYNMVGTSQTYTPGDILQIIYNGANVTFVLNNPDTGIYYRVSTPVIITEEYLYIGTIVGDPPQSNSYTFLNVNIFTTGSIGPTGPNGSIGVRGYTGYTGPRGNTGYTGYTGPRGNTGVTGYTGYTGYTGPVGVPGTSSNTGATGATGPIGSIGPTGAGGTIAYYGNYYSTDNQTINFTPTQISFPNNFEQFGISVDSASNITFAYAGTYQIKGLLQVDANNNAVLNYWYKLNGNDVDNSSFQYNFSGGAFQLVATNSFIFNANAGDVISLWAIKTNGNISLTYVPSSTSPAYPGSPSVNVLVNQIAYTISGLTGPTGYTGPIGPIGPVGPVGPSISYSLGNYPYVSGGSLITTTIGTNQTAIYEVGPIDTTITPTRLMIFASASFTAINTDVQLTVGRSVLPGASSITSFNIASNQYGLVLPVQSTAYYMAALADSNSGPANINGFAIDYPTGNVYYYRLWMSSATPNNYSDMAVSLVVLKI